mgnify:FL=1
MTRRNLWCCVVSALLLVGQATYASDPVSAYNTIPDDIGKLNYRMQNGPRAGSLFST